MPKIQDEKSAVTPTAETVETEIIKPSDEDTDDEYQPRTTATGRLPARASENERS